MRAADANRSPVVLVGPEHGYGPGGRLFAELLGREYDLVEVGIASAGGAPESLVDRVRAGVERLRARGGDPALVGDVRPRQSAFEAGPVQRRVERRRVETSRGRPSHHRVPRTSARS